MGMVNSRLICIQCLDVENCESSVIIGLINVGVGQLSLHSMNAACISFAAELILPELRNV